MEELAITTGEEMTTIMKTCDHRESSDPRRKGTCYRCGALLPQRDPDGERALIGRVTADEELSSLVYSLCTRRAGVSEPWQRVLVRDWKREALEEAIDGVNYCMAEAARRRELGYEDELSSGRLMALHHFVEAIRCLVTDTDD